MPSAIFPSLRAVAGSVASSTSSASSSGFSSGNATRRVRALLFPPPLVAWLRQNNTYERIATGGSLNMLGTMGRGLVEHHFNLMVTSSQMDNIIPPPGGGDRDQPPPRRHSDRIAEEARVVVVCRKPGTWPPNMQEKLHAQELQRKMVIKGALAEMS